jgi:hypothetical protein
MWMFCEGVYLHRLISTAFAEERSLILFYGIGWGEYNSLTETIHLTLLTINFEDNVPSPTTLVIFLKNARVVKTMVIEYR